MGIADNPFSMSTMSNGLQDLSSRATEESKNYPKGISSSIPPPGFTPRASAPSLNWLFNLMTNSDGVAQFKETISNLNQRELQSMASLLTSDSDYFLEIIRNKYGSIRVQKLLGKSDDADVFFCSAIFQRFIQIMTDKYARYVAMRAMLVVHPEMKEALYDHTLHHAPYIACDQYGCIALNDVVTDIDDLYYRNQLLDLVAYNALFLSNDASGNFVVQHALKLDDLRCTRNITLNLRGHFVDLSFRKHGSYIVEMLLEAEYTMVVVVVELLECEGDRLMRLARNEYGNFVVSKALRVTEEMTRIDLFLGLVHKLKPFTHLLRRSHGSNIANILESMI